MTLLNKIFGKKKNKDFPKIDVKQKPPIFTTVPKPIEHAEPKHEHHEYPPISSSKDRVLFVLKNIEEYTQSSALEISSKMIATYLESTGTKCKVVTVDLSHDIPSEINIFRPTVVVIEALWVTGPQLKGLSKLYPNIKWIIRIHSDAGFLAVEPKALHLVREYLNLRNSKIVVSCNNEEFNEELSKACDYNFQYLPNIVDIHNDCDYCNCNCCSEHRHHDREDRHHINIGCFGSLRPLKNQLYQAICSINAADKLGLSLHFHINDPDDESNPIFLNLKELFAINTKHKLYIHDWMKHSEFVKVVKKMDLGLQLSYSESFNFVTSDFVNYEIPILVSESITWMPKLSMTSTVDYDDTIDKIRDMIKRKHEIHLLIKLNKNHLVKYNDNSKKIWDKFIK